jgi:hypothetical protein
MDSDKHMPYVMMTNLVSEHESTAISPNMLMRGRETFGLNLWDVTEHLTNIIKHVGMEIYGKSCQLSGSILKNYILRQDIPWSQDMTPIKTYRFWLCTFLKRMPDENLSKYHKNCHTACINSIVKAMGNQLLFIVIYCVKDCSKSKGEKTRLKHRFKMNQITKSMV